MKKRFTFLLAITAAFTLSACSIFESKDTGIIFDTVLGPETEVQIAELPETLQGDTENANYSSENLKGDKMESSDGSGTE